MFSLKFRESIIFLLASNSILSLFSSFLSDLTILINFLFYFILVFLVLWITAATTWRTVIFFILKLRNFVCLLNTCNNFMIRRQRRLSKQLFLNFLHRNVAQSSWNCYLFEYIVLHISTICFLWFFLNLFH